MKEDISLTKREREVLRLLVKGFNNIEIGKALIISPVTAKAHVASIVHKMGVRTRLQAALKAIKLKIEDY